MGDRLLVYGLTVDRLYRTRAGNVVRCVKHEAQDLFTCEYISTVVDHRRLLGLFQTWTADGLWEKMPGGMNDLVEELAP